jgi:hypothetical protein
MNRNRSEGIAENIILPPGFLSVISSEPIESCLLQMVGCPVPEYRPDLKELGLSTTEDYFLQQIDLIKEHLIGADRPHGMEL